MRKRLRIQEEKERKLEQERTTDTESEEESNDDATNFAQEIARFKRSVNQNIMNRKEGSNTNS